MDSNLNPPRTHGSGGVTPSLIIGFFLALLAMGLPLIGVTVNLYLGVLILLVAFALLAYGFWTWETAYKWGTAARTSTLWLLGLIYFALIGYQISSQFKKDHPTISGKSVAVAPELHKEEPRTAVVPSPVEHITKPPQPRPTGRPATPRSVAPKVTKSPVIPPTISTGPLTQSGRDCLAQNIGSGTLNQTCAPASRVLTDVNLGKFKAALQGSGGAAIVMAAGTSEDIEPLTAQLQDAIASARWSGMQGPFGSLMFHGRPPRAVGIECYAPDWGSEPASTLKRAITESQIQCKYEDRIFTSSDGQAPFGPTPVILIGTPEK
jgi:hypothetical protein